MELLTTRDGKEVWLHQMERPYQFEPPFLERRYVAIVFANDESVGDAERRSITRALFASGCRYGVFAGHACGAWELALDTACMESAPDFEPSDDAITATTSHEQESIGDVMFFGLTCTSFGSHDFDRLLVLFIGPRARLREEVQLAIQSVWHEDHAG